MNPKLTVCEVPDTLHGLSANWWIDRGLFSDWFFNHFLVYAQLYPLLVILDGHFSHYCPDIIQAASEQQIMIFAVG